MGRLKGVYRLVLGISILLVSSFLTPIFVGISVVLGFVDILWKILTGASNHYARQWSRAVWDWYFNKWQFAFHGERLTWTFDV